MDDIKLCVLRLIQEVNGFVERPDYKMPEDVGEAVETLSEHFYFSGDDMLPGCFGLSNRQRRRVK
jgi:hypothetical protein